MRPLTLTTALTSKLGIRVPIIQAPIGSFSCPELAAAVSNAGGLGTLALSWDSIETCQRKIRDTKALTQVPFGINLVLEWDQRERLEACLDAGARIISFFWGDASHYIERAHRAQAKAMITVGSAAEAKQAAAAGADVIVCQGYEAGGHVCGSVGSIALIPSVVDAVAPIPVVAAGGFADGRGLAAALSLGATGVWMGTRFSASEESRAHPQFKRMLESSQETSTEYLALFDGGWPNAAHRVLRNSTVEAWHGAKCPPTGKRPNENQVIGQKSDGTDIHLYDDTPPVAGMAGDWEACALYAGQSVGLVRKVRPAAEIVHEITAQALQVLARLAPKTE